MHQNIVIIYHDIDVSSVLFIIYMIMYIVNSRDTGRYSRAYSVKYTIVCTEIKQESLYEEGTVNSRMVEHLMKTVIHDKSRVVIN